MDVSTPPWKTKLTKIHAYRGQRFPSFKTHRARHNEREAKVSEIVFLRVEMERQTRKGGGKRAHDRLISVETQIHEMDAGTDRASNQKEIGGGTALRASPTSASPTAEKHLELPTYTYWTYAYVYAYT